MATLGDLNITFRDPELAAQIATLIDNQELIMAILDDLRASVALDTGVTQSAITLLQGLAAKLEAAGTDEAALAEIRDELNHNTEALANAVSANTPAAPAPTEPPADTPPVDTPPADVPPVDVPTDTPPADVPADPAPPVEG